MIDTAFTGTTSRVAGMTLVELASETLSLHAKAFPELNRSKLEFMGFAVPHEWRVPSQYSRDVEGVACSGQGRTGL